MLHGKKEVEMLSIPFWVPEEGESIINARVFISSKVNVLEQVVEKAESKYNQYRLICTDINKLV